MPKPKILFLDIETAPDLGYVWTLYQTNVIEVKEPWYILSYAAKWKGEKAFVRGLNDWADYGLDMSNDHHLMRELWLLLDKADIIVAHNGMDFDLKKINARFIVHGMKPPSPYVIVDTKREAKKVARFSSNRLDSLCDQLDIGRKLRHQGFSMWLGCMAGDAACWKTMKRYNLHDIKLLEGLYNELAPWMRQPNGAMWGRNCTNPACSSKRKMHSDGIRRNKSRAYRRLVCMDCGARAQGTFSLPSPRADRVPA